MNRMSLSSSYRSWICAFYVGTWMPKMLGRFSLSLVFLPPILLALEDAKLTKPSAMPDARAYPSLSTILSLVGLRAI